jgi:hypothetical protein
MECGSRYVSGAYGLKGMTVDDMKRLLGEVGLSRSGTRQDLCQSIIDGINTGILRIDPDGKIRSIASPTTQSPTQLPMQLPALPPVQLPTQLPPVQLPTQSPMQLPALPTMQLPPVQLPTQLPPIFKPTVQLPPALPPMQFPTVQLPTQSPMQLPTQSPMQFPTQLPKVQLPPTILPPTFQPPTQQRRKIMQHPGTLPADAHPMIIIGHGQYETVPKAPPSYLGGGPSPVNEMIEETVIEGDMDDRQKEYLNYVEFLLQGHVKYDLFAKVFPNYTCERVAIYVNEKQAYAWPSEINLVECIDSKVAAGFSVAISVISPGHATIMWFDARTRTVDRYDSHRSGFDENDRAIQPLIKRLFPEWNYVGNIAKTTAQCVQIARATQRRPGEGKRKTYDWFCQDYTLLYALLRIRGYSFNDASQILVDRRDDILLDIADLMRVLVYQARLTVGKEPIIGLPDVDRILR